MTTTLNGTQAPVTRRPTSNAARIVDWRRRPEPFNASWEDRAACYNRPADWWDGDDRDLTEKARAVCLSCPVLDACLRDRMRDEGHELGFRYAVRGGLTGPERIQLYVESPTLAGLDAEESRLLALEAVATGRKVAEIAGEGVPSVTVRLAARLAGEPVPVATVELPGDSGLRRALSRAADIMRLAGQGESAAQIATGFGLARCAVESVMKLYQDAAVAPELEAGVDAIDEWLAGRDVALSAEERLVALRRAMQMGRSFQAVDRARGLRPGTTKSWLARQRRAYRERGLECPVPTLEEFRQQSMEVAA